MYKKNKSRLDRYAAADGRAAALVPNLGISRPYIFDLMRGGSFVEFMTGRARLYLVDWGIFEPEDIAST